MKILFVCTGNTCRSCMAEAIFNEKCNIEDLKAFSAGLSVVTDSVASKHSSKLVLDNLNFDISGRKAVQITETVINEADLILTMTNRMVDLFKVYFPKNEYKVFSLNSYVGVEGDIADPFGGDMEVYRKTYEMLDNSISLLLLKLKEDMSIS